MAALDAAALAALLVELGRRTALAGVNYFRAKAYCAPWTRSRRWSGGLRRAIAESRVSPAPCAMTWDVELVLAAPRDRARLQVQH
jgi:hypothetical protein